MNKGLGLKKVIKGPVEQLIPRLLMLFSNMVLCIFALQFN